MKYRIKDEDGQLYEVEEIDAMEEAEPKKIEENDVCDEDTTSLSDDEINALKRLAAVADKLIALTSTTDSDEECEECEDDEPIDADIDEKEEIVDTDEELSEEDKDAIKPRDSKSSFGAIEKRNTTKDSESLEYEINDAWSKRYNGGNN